MVFTWDKALNFEGNSGPYIQYAFVRAKKIAENFDGKYTLDADFSLSPFDKKLIQKNAEFEKKILETLAKYKPHTLANYAYELAVECNSFYVHTPKILEEKDENLKNFRLALLAKTAKTLKQAFSLLAIEMPSQM